MSTFWGTSGIFLLTFRGAGSVPSSNAKVNFVRSKWRLTLVLQLV